MWNLCLFIMFIMCYTHLAASCPLWFNKYKNKKCEFPDYAKGPGQPSGCGHLVRDRRTKKPWRNKRRKDLWHVSVVGFGYCRGHFGVIVQGDWRNTQWQQLVFQPNFEQATTQIRVFFSYFLSLPLALVSDQLSGLGAYDTRTDRKWQTMFVR